MPHPFVPKESGRHRIACIALYRALLSQCSRVKLPSESFLGPINPIKHFIRKQFRRNQHDTSARLIVSALKIGYETEELLRSAGDGNKTSFSKVLGLLKELQSQGRADRTRVAQKPASPKVQFRKPAPYLNAPKALEIRPRPLSELSGRRHVPILTAANGIPFLRFTKPQSPFLSRVLRDKINRRQKTLDHIARLEAEILRAAQEDEWERLVGVKDSNGNEVSYKEEVVRAKIEPDNDFIRYQEEAREFSSKMLKIVDEEKRLCEEERIEALKEKSARRRERKQSCEGFSASKEPSGPGGEIVEFKTPSPNPTVPISTTPA